MPNHRWEISGGDDKYYEVLHKVIKFIWNLLTTMMPMSLIYGVWSGRFVAPQPLVRGEGLFDVSSESVVTCPQVSQFFRRRLKRQLSDNVVGCWIPPNWQNLSKPVKNNPAVHLSKIFLFHSLGWCPRPWKVRRSGDGDDLSYCDGRCGGLFAGKHLCAEKQSGKQNASDGLDPWGLPYHWLQQVLTRYCKHLICSARNLFELQHPVMIWQIAWYVLMN